jgi:hypothetical protein
VLSCLIRVAANTGQSKYRAGNSYQSAMARHLRPLRATMWSRSSRRSWRTPARLPRGRCRGPISSPPAGRPCLPRSSSTPWTLAATLAPSGIPRRRSWALGSDSPGIRQTRLPSSQPGSTSRCTTTWYSGTAAQGRVETACCRGGKASAGRRPPGLIAAAKFLLGQLARTLRYDMADEE